MSYKISKYPLEGKKVTECTPDVWLCSLRTIGIPGNSSGRGKGCCCWRQLPIMYFLAYFTLVFPKMLRFKKLSLPSVVLFCRKAIAISRRLRVE